MIDCGSLEMAQARIGARHGERLREADWQRIEVLRELRPLVDQARNTALRPWLEGIDASSDAHRIESTLRARWRAIVAEVADWMPAEWRRAILWCATLPDLAPFEHLARGDEPPLWMRDDETWRDVCSEAPASRPARLAEGPLAALVVAWPAPEALAQAWNAEWRRRWPVLRRDAEEMLERVARAWTLRVDRSIAPTDADGWFLRGARPSQLSLLLRRAALQPAAAFIHLALCAIDLDRLRAELLARVVFGRWKAA